MKTQTILLLLIVSFSSCKMNDAAKQREAAIVRELVLLRTEGLALAEFVGAKSIDADVIQIGEQLRAYYQQTHPDFLQACTGSQIDLNDADFDSLWTNISDRFVSTDQSMESICLQLCDENIRASIKLYEDIIRTRESEKISYFSFIALPDLYNQQQELHKVRSHFQAQQVQVSL